MNQNNTRSWETDQLLYAFEEIAANAEIESTEDYEGENIELREMFYKAMNSLTSNFYSLPENIS